MKRWASAFRAFGLGWYFAACVFLGGFAGHWLDTKLGTQVLFLILGIILGIVSGIYGIYRTISPDLNNNRKGRKN